MNYESRRSVGWGEEERERKINVLMIGKIMSWNIRCLNDKGKRLILRGCLAKWKPEIVCLQETKLE